MMRLAVIRCQNGPCLEWYDVGLYGDEAYAKCPVCGQFNNVPDQLPHLTGKCICGKAIDDHPLSKVGQIVRCP